MKIPRFRWCIAGLLLLASILNYIDRQTLSILAPTIQADLALTDAQYGNIVSLFLVAVRLLVFRQPRDHPWLTPAERALIQADEPDPAETAAEPKLSEGARWKSIVTTPAVWALMLARLLTDPVWYFFQFWMPEYLHSVRGFEQADLAHMWMIYLAADVGFIGSGFVSGWLIRGGSEARTARLRTMLGCAMLVPLAPLIALSSGNAGVFGVAMIVALAHTAWLASISGNYQRHRRHPLAHSVTATKLRIVIHATNGDPAAGIYEIRCYAD